MRGENPAKFQSITKLKILRGELAEAQDLLERSVALVEARKKEWYVIQSLRNLAS